MNNPFEVLEARLDSIQALLNEALRAKSTTDQATEIIDRKELCKRLNITEPTAILWGKKGKIPTLRVGSAVRYNWLKVLEALEQK